MSPFTTFVPKLGTEVFAIGSPLSFSHSVTKGIVSAVDRTLNYATLIQTDAAINPGNSGGPLIGDGRFLGINTITLDNAEGINFAVDAKTIFRIVPELIKNNGRFERANSGIRFEDTSLKWMSADNRTMRYHSGRERAVKLSTFDHDIFEHRQGSCDLEKGNYIKAIDGHQVVAARQAQILVNNVAVASEAINFERCKDTRRQDCGAIECSFRAVGFDRSEKQWRKRFWSIDGEDMLTFLQENIPANDLESRFFPCLSGVKSIRTARGDQCGVGEGDVTTCGVELEYQETDQECLTLVDGKLKADGEEGEGVLVVDRVHVQLYDRKYADTVTFVQRHGAGAEERKHDFYLLRINLSEDGEVYDLDSFHWIMKFSVEQAIEYIRKRRQAYPDQIFIPAFKLMGKEIGDKRSNEIEIEFISMHLWDLRRSLRDYYDHRP